MAGYGAGRSMAYSDYYNNSSKTPNTNSNSDLSNSPDTQEPKNPSDAIRQRKAALKRRLKMRKVSMG